MSLTPLPTTTNIVTDANGRPKSDLYLERTYQSWFAAIQRWLGPIGQNGTTAARPTKNLYVGLSYYDTTLGYPVFVHQVSPSIIWHNGAGAAV